ncbi:TPA: fimbrial protein [Salmonella enterica subsp. enterica serovar Kintambo]|nr:fimbrial protein [Salmonella enterica subsp. enterica serovar Kintambo]EIJ8715633.1 fimbrial protein [Salmonella enterica]HCI4751689.1 fimbrial protein [Salmonella enterica subsp. enterica serovar Kintambo]
MKKTVIAAALASTVFSGAAMAWNAGGSGGNIEIGGSIQVTPYSTPWEVMTGVPATSLDTNITKGVSVVNIPVTKAIPVLGIRTVSKTLFTGKAEGISPEINYGAAVNVATFENSITTLTLPLMDASTANAGEIGTMNAKFIAAARSSSKYLDNPSHGFDIIASPDGNKHAFLGGLPQSKDKAAANSGSLAAQVFPGVEANFNSQGVTSYSNDWMNFNGPQTKYSAYYGAGIPANSDIKLTLTAPAANDAIKWKASLPITVSYR